MNAGNQGGNAGNVGGNVENAGSDGIAGNHDWNVGNLGGNVVVGKTKVIVIFVMAYSRKLIFNCYKSIGEV